MAGASLWGIDDPVKAYAIANHLRYLVGGVATRDACLASCERRGTCLSAQQGYVCAIPCRSNEECPSNLKCLCAKRGACDFPAYESMDGADLDGVCVAPERYRVFMGKR